MLKCNLKNRLFKQGTEILGQYIYVQGQAKHIYTSKQLLPLKQKKNNQPTKTATTKNKRKIQELGSWGFSKI